MMLLKRKNACGVTVYAILPTMARGAKSNVRMGIVFLGVLLTQSIGSAVAVSAPFPDMEWSWVGYQDNVSYLVGKGAIAGYPDGNFRPKDKVNRAEFLKMVFRARGTVEPAAGSCFPDVPVDAWYAPYVCAAKRRGIINGYRVGSRYIFRPERPIVFAEAIKIALLAYGNEIEEGSGSQWYAPYVNVLDRRNILPAWSNIPWEEITRERAADLIARLVRHSEESSAPHRSPGCSATGRSPSLTLTINGQERTYLLSTPRGVSSSTPAPLIVAFHGRTNSNEQVRGYFGFEKTATDYYVAYPAAISNGNGSYAWSDAGDKASQLRDFQFFDAIVKEIGNNACIDMDKIYVVGHSLGAWFANSVACARGGVVRASATVGGSTTMQGCSGPTAAMIINNPADTLSPHVNAETMRDVRIAENACTQTSKSVEPASLKCVQYGRCSDNPVLFCPHTIDTAFNGTYYPHTWPDGTAKAMLNFFEGL